MTTSKIANLFTLVIFPKFNLKPLFAQKALLAPLQPSFCLQQPHSNSLAATQARPAPRPNEAAPHRENSPSPRSRTA